jgi:hypothetical protein
MKALCLIFIATLVAMCAAAQSNASKPAPRLANGKPDLSGVWDHPRVGDVSKDYDGRCAGGTPGCSSKGAHDIDSTLTAYGKAENAKTKFDYGVHCLPWGYVRSWGTPYPVEIFQRPEKMAILFEQNNMFHVVPTDGRDHPKQIYPTWLGDSVGHWEGDTLVVDVTSFNDKTWLVGTGTFHSEALHVVERYTRVDKDQINYDITMEDPNVLTRPWVIHTNLMLREGTHLEEYVCAENNLAPSFYERLQKNNVNFQRP